MAFTSHLNHMAKQASKAHSSHHQAALPGDSKLIKASAIIGLATGLVSAGLYILYRQF
jgi:hypothetical protein